MSVLQVKIFGKIVEGDSRFYIAKKFPVFDVLFHYELL